VAVHELYTDLFSSKKWLTMFGTVQDKPPSDKFLEALVKEYKECKDKEKNASIRRQRGNFKQPIKISNSLSSSAIAFQGRTPGTFSSRTKAAKSIGRVNNYAAERRRLLSIVACDFSQSFLTEHFQCSKGTVTAARVHCILFGRGRVPPASMKFTRQCVTKEVLDGLADFLIRDDISRPSSYSSVVVDGEECAVRYWQDSIKNLVQQYILEFPDGLKRSYIYTHLPENYRSNSMLAGLCNLCEDFGYSNFQSLTDIVKTLSSTTMQHELGSTIDDIRRLQRYLKTKFAHEVRVTNIEV